MGREPVGFRNQDCFLQILMRRFLYALGLLCASVARAAYTYTLPDLEQPTIEALVYNGYVGGVFVKNLEAGDTIILPAGSATWGNPIAPNGSAHINAGRIFVSTAVTIKGQGDSTVISLHEDGGTYANPVLCLLAACTIKDLKIIGALTRPVSAIQVTADGTRITNVTYEGRGPDPTPGDGTQGDGYFVYQKGVTGTLIDHCRISAVIGTHEWIFTRGPANAWQTATPVGTSQMDVFVEDCTFTGVGYSDSNANGRHVFRFNRITGDDIKFDAHGYASNSDPTRGTRAVEYYWNTWTSSAMSTRTAMEIRGGHAIVFNNTSTTGLIFLRDYAYDNAYPNFGNYFVTITAGSPVTITTASPHGYETGWPVYIDCLAQNIVGFYTVTKVSPTVFTVVRPEATSGTGWNVRRYYTAYDWPIIDQVGNGADGGAREPAYIWSNTQGGSSWARSLATPNSNAQTLYAAQTGTPGATFGDRDVIQANRDFFASSGFDLSTGVTVGNRASMDAFNTTGLTTGYGYWVTDEGSWNTKLTANTSGRLYKWTGSAWSLYYTPYTYPHPLQTATEVAQPEPSVRGGTYEYAQTVSLQVTPSDATVRYTLDGSTPSQSVGTIYSGAITISSTTNVKAIGYKTGLSDSSILDATYTITGQVFTPTSSVQTGSYHGTQNVTLLCATSGSEIRYTTDGTTPNGSSPLYSSAISVDRTKTIKAIGIKSGLTTSTVLTIDVTILLEIGNWDLVGTTKNAYDNWERTGLAYFTANVAGNLTKVSIYGTNTSSTQDVEIGLYHDTSGNNSSGLTKITGTPTAITNVGTWENAWKDFTVDFPVTVGEKYWIFINVSESSSLSILAKYAGGTDGRWNNGGTYGTAWNDVSYTTNRDGWYYNVKGTLTETGGTVPDAAMPVASTAGGNYQDNLSVTLSTATSGAAIYYTTDGTTPSASSQLYDSAINITLGGPGTTVRVLKAIAIKSGSNDSAVMQEIYFMFVPTVGLSATTLNVGTLVLQ